MSAPSKPSVFEPVDKAAFLRFIATEPEGRYEFERGRIVQQMTGGTETHFRLARRISLLLEPQLDAGVWRVLQDWGVETPETVRYADVVVYPAGGDGRRRWTNAPAVVVEVLSPSTIRTDIDIKPAEYLALGSLQAYIVASQTDPVCLAWVRGGDGQFPGQPVEFGAGNTIDVCGLHLALAIDDIYRGIELLPRDAFPNG
jgi:Uma2 family endonuclease